MGLASVYPQIKAVHVALVAASGTLFAARGVSVLAGLGWPMRAAVRRASVVVDTLLLAAGATLWHVLRLNPLRDGWLGSKLALLVAYVVLGSFALRRAPTPRSRALFFVLSLAAFAAMVLTALTKRTPFA